jgi:hypothetical protein
MTAQLFIRGAEWLYPSNLRRSSTFITKDYRRGAFTLMRHVIVAAGLALASPVFAQAPAPQVAAGTAITGPAGQPVGTVVSVVGTDAVVRTDKYDVRVPIASMRVDAKGAVIGMTRDQLNAGIEDALAKVNQLLVVGAPVYDPAGGNVGNVDLIEDQFVTLKLPSGKSVRLARSGFSMGRHGLLIGLTAAQIEAQLPS